MEGLVLKSENARVASIFYMEDYFSYWERGVPLEQLVRKVMWQFEHCKPQMDVEADFFQNYQEIKGIKHHFDDKEVLRDIFANE